MDKYTKAQLKRTRNARHFMKNTCPASRHVHLIAESLAKGDKYHMIDEEPEHVAVSLLSVLESLWNLRTETGWPSKKEARRMGRAVSKALSQVTNGDR
jgi:hypothetical protein